MWLDGVVWRFELLLFFPFLFVSEAPCCVGFVDLVLEFGFVCVVDWVEKWNAGDEGKFYL
jgi:hypothetical protein